MTYFSLLTILPLYIVASTTYKSAEKTIKQNASLYSSAKLQQAINSVDLYVENADNIVQSLYFNNNLIQLINDSTKSEYDRSISMVEVQELLKSYIYPAKYISELYIIDTQNNVFASDRVSSEGLIKDQWYQEFRDGDSKQEILSTHDVGGYFSKTGSLDTKVITILRKFTNIETKELIGVVGIDVNYSYICDIFEDDGSDDMTMTILCTDQGEVVYGQNTVEAGTILDKSRYQQVFDTPSGSYMQKIGQETYFVVFTTSEKMNWKLIQLIPTSSLFSEVKDIKLNTFFIGLLCIFFSMLLSVGASYSICVPIKKLRNEMAKVEKGDLDVHMDQFGKDEIGELSKSFNRMIEKLSASIWKIYENENAKKQIELNMLQQQINPHFLFNTLDSINWMARMQNAQNIATIITSLVKLLQASTYTNSDFVTIRDEIENVKNYIVIQKFRYGSKFDVIYDVEEDMKDNYTLKLILQPLVENAIYHGLEDKEEGGIITIGGRVREKSIQLYVEDNGKGIEQEKINQIFLEHNKESNRYSSIGISNTAKRIKLYYGENYGLEIMRIEQGGTRILITIPIRSTEREKLDTKLDQTE